MSTTFEVYPGVHDVLAVDELLRVGGQFLSEYLNRNGLPYAPGIAVQLRRNRTHEQVPWSNSDPARWGYDVCAWPFGGFPPPVLRAGKGDRPRFRALVRSISCPAHRRPEARLTEVSSTPFRVLSSDLPAPPLLMLASAALEEGT